MTGTANPIALIGGLATTADVSKPDFVSWAEARVAQVLADASEINSTDLTGQLMVTLLSAARLYKLDTSDTTTADDGVTCIRDANGLAFKIVTIDGLDGVDGTSALTRVRVVAITNVNLASALANGQTVDGVTLVTNDLVLAAGQSTASQNGVYVVPASGAASRDASFSTYDEHPGTFFSVEEGTSNKNTLWQCTSAKGGTLGSTSIAIGQFSSGVIPPATNTDAFIPQWNGANSKTLKDGLQLDTDGTLAANSDTRIPSQKAVKTYVAANGTAITNLITPEQYGAKGDGIVYTSGMAISASSPNLTISGYTPTSADVGKYVAIDGAGSAGACFVSTVSSISGSNLVLAANASTTVSSAAGEIGTDDSTALHNMAAASSGKAVWFGPGKIYFHKDASGNANMILFAGSNFHIYGNNATVRAMANAPSQTYGFCFAGTSALTTSGGSNFSISDLIYHGNRTRRISSSAITAAVGSGTGFYFWGCRNFDLTNITAINTTCDGCSIGGGYQNASRTSSFWSVRGGSMQDAGRNGFALFGASYGSFVGVLSENHTFGIGHSNISYGWDFEPDDTPSSNADINCTSCIASNCQTGFGSNLANGSNDAVVWGQCRAEACTNGFYESAAGTTKVFAATYAGNTTNFTNLAEKISGF